MRLLDTYSAKSCLIGTHWLRCYSSLASSLKISYVILSALSPRLSLSSLPPLLKYWCYTPYWWRSRFSTRFLAYRRGLFDYDDGQSLCQSVQSFLSAVLAVILHDRPSRIGLPLTAYPSMITYWYGLIHCFLRWKFLSTNTRRRPLHISVIFSLVHWRTESATQLWLRWTR